MIINFFLGLHLIFGFSRSLTFLIETFNAKSAPAPDLD